MHLDARDNVNSYGRRGVINLMCYSNGVSWFSVRWYFFFLVGHILSCCLSLQFLSFLFLVLFSLLAFVFFTRSFAGKRNTKTNTTDKSSFLCFFHFRSCFVFFICIHIVFSLEIVMLILKLLRYKLFNLHLKK